MYIGNLLFVFTNLSGLKGNTRDLLQKTWQIGPSPKAKDWQTEWQCFDLSTEHSSQQHRSKYISRQLFHC